MMIAINEDNDNYFKYPPEYMTEESLRRYVDYYAERSISHIFYCLCGQRTSFRSAAWESIWDPQPDGSVSDNIWAQNCMLLYKKGLDPYSIWISQCRKRGISPFISVRLNDVHFVDVPNYFRNTNFWREHPELHRKMPEASRSWDDYAFDYSKEPAREYALALIREVIERYDADGYELDFMRWPSYLTPGKEREQAPILTAFVGEVSRLIADAETTRNHPITLAVRVPATPEIALSRGIDVKGFVEQAKVTMVTVSSFFASMDPDLSSTRWREYLGTSASGVTLLPAVDDGSAPGVGLPRRENTAAVLRGWVDTVLADGFDGLYFFNFPYILMRENERPFAVSDATKDFLMTSENLLTGEKHYPLSFRDVSGGSEGNLSQLPSGLPARLSFKTGRAPSGGDVRFELEFRLKRVVPFWENTAPKVDEILFNGNRCAFECRGATCMVRGSLEFFQDFRNSLEIVGDARLEIVSATLICDGEAAAT